jgi:hypothetical protein
MNAEMKASQERTSAEIKAAYVDAKARQEKADADAKARHEEAEASQEKADAKIEARLERMEATMYSMRSDIERSLHQQMGALLEGSRSFGTRTTICRVPPATCQTETTSSSEEMEATNLEATSEETEAAVERQKR